MYQSPSTILTSKRKQISTTSKRCLSETRDVPDVWFRLARYPAILSNRVPAPSKTVPGTGYFSHTVLGPFWQLVHP